MFSVSKHDINTCRYSVFHTEYHSNMKHDITHPDVVWLQQKKEEKN